MYFEDVRWYSPSMWLSPSSSSSRASKWRLERQTLARYDVSGSSDDDGDDDDVIHVQGDGT